MILNRLTGFSFTYSEKKVQIHLYNNKHNTVTETFATISFHAPIAR